MFRKVQPGPLLPLGHYLFDKDVVPLLKCVYSENHKGDIAEDEHAMVTFFGSVEEGNRVLEDLAISEWEDM